MDWRMLGSGDGEIDVLWLQVNTQLGVLPFPLRGQRLEQIIQL